MYVLKIRTLVKNLNISHTSGTTKPLYMQNSSDSGIYRAPRDSAKPADIEGAKASLLALQRWGWPSLQTSPFPLPQSNSGDLLG